MNSLQSDILMQCPCGGNGGGNPVLLLAVFVGAWLLFNWIRMLMKSKGVSFMNKAVKIVIVVALIVLVGAVFALKQQGENTASEPVVAAGAETETTAETAAKLPHLIDLGASKCTPCKMMKPMLDDLKQNYNEQFKVTFIDVWENPGEAKKYNIRMIPTQIFYDANGNELFRHEGFYSKEDILGKWKELNIDIEKGSGNDSN